MEMRKGNAGGADMSQLDWKAEYAYTAGMQAFSGYHVSFARSLIRSVSDMRGALAA